ncbi:LysR family transcriptional regulator [Undibacterium fentianense]|uniref:LysR family transcriptional regulator n=1 Tax=Undibacterium fentianense TaxID=2828728 RepID=A0A941E3K0_9BURK|nr:LysR family transcriptional regulator [Undibacterium fentianense]MBR7800366.1 LysR family transcriptional regulator [Undibacterium fentianense]
MQLDPNDLLMFSRVVTEGSFSKAAERLGVPKSTLSRRISALETHLGERLLLRTTRKLVVTDFGHAVLAHAQQVHAEVEATLALTQQRQAEPSGRLRISMPADFANEMMTNLIARFLDRYPAIQLELDLSPRRVDLIGENFDLAIRMGSLTDDASLAARQLAMFSAAMYASPAYLKKHGEPHEPEALMEHQTLRLLGRNGEPVAWRLKNKLQTWEGVPPGIATANSPELLKRLALEGVGITLISEHFARCHLHDGSLIRVLPEWHAPEYNAWAVFPGRRLMPARTRAFIDAILEEFNLNDTNPICR